ncbi:MAG TPA: outer membrane beta-barrel protein [Steroidobacteraceae bacterium]|nr:outer membrane beta-barrel protein [Steroidobacteraceae bacterium]
MIRALASTVALACLALQVSAEPSGVYFGAAIGNSHQHLGKGEGINVLISSPFAPSNGLITLQPSSKDSDEKDRSIAGLVGYRFNRYLAAELGYADFGDAAMTEHYQLPEDVFPLGAPEITRSLSTNISGPTLTALGIYPFGTRFDVFLRAGLLFADQQVRMEGARPENYADTVWVGGIGGDYRFADRWSARIEYQRTDEIDAPQQGNTNRLTQVVLSVIYHLAKQ